MSRRTRKGCLILVGVLAVVGGIAPFACGEDHPAQQTIRGLIIDPATYLKGGQPGAQMVDEVYRAVDGGQSLALLDEENNILYFLLAEEPGEDPNELAYDHAGEHVKVTGKTYERGGMRGIVATAVEPLTPEGTAQSTPPSAPTE